MRVKESRPAQRKQGLGISSFIFITFSRKVSIEATYITITFSQKCPLKPHILQYLLAKL